MHAVHPALAPPYTNETVQVRLRQLENFPEAGREEKCVRGLKTLC